MWLLRLWLCVAFCMLLPRPAEAQGVAWDEERWGTFSTAEFAAFAFFATSTALLNLHLSPTTRSHQGGILLDDPVREALRLESPTTRRIAAIVSDALLLTLVSWPLLDSAGNWALQGDSQVTEQMILITALSYATTWLLNSGAKNVAARERPWGEHCQGRIGSRCGSSERYRSFFSGHAAFSFTAAGLVCAHHSNIPLYDSRALDWAACGVSLGVATTVALLRIMSDRHYLSDVVVGAIVGFLSGFVLPTVLHYGR